MAFALTSTAFRDGERVPDRYTCTGEDISPPLAWTQAPAGTKSFALIADDPDAPVGTWVHWVLFNLPADTTRLSENIPDRENVENGGRQGINDFRKYGYGGPCPPKGVHRYFFKIYALDAKLSLKAGASKKDLLKAMEGHIFAEGELMGRYKR